MGSSMAMVSQSLLSMEGQCSLPVFSSANPNRNVCLHHTTPWSLIFTHMDHVPSPCITPIDRYEGAWVNGKKHGWGSYTWPYGAVYEGPFLDGLMHGVGQQTDPDGSVFVVKFEAGECLGKESLSGAAFV